MEYLLCYYIVALLILEELIHSDDVGVVLKDNLDLIEGSLQAL